MGSINEVELNDAELVRKTLSGDKEAYCKLVVRYQGHVYGLAYSLVNNWADAQDIAQETFIRTYCNLDQLRDPACYAAWLRRVTFSVSMNWVKAFRPDLFGQLGSLEDIDSLNIPDFAPGPPEVAERRELAEAVLRAVASLPPRYRVPLTMFHLDGLSYQKVADFLDIPIGTAKSLIHRAREMLKPALSAYNSYVIEEVSSMIQEVFNEYRLPPEFSLDVWKLCMDWLCMADRPPEDSEKRREKAERIALAAIRDPDVAMVNKWRQEAEPIPNWALSIDKETPRWGFEACNHGWVQQLERMVWMIGHETSLPNPPPGKCGSLPVSRRQWAILVDDALSHWLNDTPVSAEDPPIFEDIYGLLGQSDAEKIGAVRLLRDTIRLAILHHIEKFEAAFAELKKDSDLAKQMRGPMKYLQFTCGYRWEKIVLELCRAIGDPNYRNSKPLAWHVGKCNGQVSFAYRDDPSRMPTTSAILVGIWAWLMDISQDIVQSTYPALALLAACIRDELGQMTPVKRWLAGRVFVGIRIWLQESDHGDIKPPQPAMDVYPTLAES